MSRLYPGAASRLTCPRLFGIAAVTNDLPVLTIGHGSRPLPFSLCPPLIISFFSSSMNHFLYCANRVCVARQFELQEALAVG